MTTWREILTTTLQDLNDPTAISVEEPLIITFCELILNIVMLRSMSVQEQKNITLQAQSIVPGMSYIPIVNIHTHLDDVSYVREARVDGVRLGRIGFSPLEAFEDQWTLHDDMRDFYTVGATLFGVRPAPVMAQEIEIIYIPYRHVHTLDDAVPLTNDYRYVLEQFLTSLLLARLGHFDRAKILLAESAGELENVRRRVVR